MKFSLLIKKERKKKQQAPKQNKQKLLHFAIQFILTYFIFHIYLKKKNETTKRVFLKIIYYLKVAVRKLLLSYSVV